MVLGHEGAGVVDAVGPGVTKIEPGDRVVLSFKPMCGQCWYCNTGQPFLCTLGAASVGGMLDGTARLRKDGADVWQMACLGTYAERVIVPVQSAVPIPPTAPLKLAALLGCGVMTGFGAALNTASIRPGDTVAVLGCGGVGLNTVQGARVCGAKEVIAIDVVGSKLGLAERFGATSLVNATDTDPVEAVRDLTRGRGVDHAFEVIGLPKTTEQTITLTRPGGETILVGLGNEPFTLIPRPFIHANKTIKGSLYGSCDFALDVHKLLDFYARGMLMLDELVSKELKLEDINEGFEAMVRGEVARSIVVF
jgi:Zn-dependent alcohol dehydrogenase